MRTPTTVVLSGALFLATAGIASAHVVVKPAQAGVAAYQTFDMGVPSEKPIATVALKLMVPTGVNAVTPNVKPGWKVIVKKDADGHATEIFWTGSSIPAGQRDDFLFSAQVPASATTLEWKAYQTYADGSVVSWDQDPSVEQPKDANGKADFSRVGPYSKTQVVNDIGAAPAPAGASNTPLLVVSIAALALSVFNFVQIRRKE